MRKSELIEKIAEKNPHLLQKDVEKIVDVTLNSIMDALSKGDRVEFRGFGAFSVKSRAARVAQNPRTGEKVSVGEKNMPHFKAGKQLFDLLNN